MGKENLVPLRGAINGHSLAGENEQIDQIVQLWNDVSFFLRHELYAKLQDYPGSSKNPVP
ncbi:hypothetical protein [Pedobacter gandavensis]|uniref:hypothetical protein n=1 Tax=Pedobacter gandavensis TaxID=2679963 RepID=UPI002930D641|nr:hypothetical protein [Pedobacter gandavensis]